MFQLRTGTKWVVLVRLAVCAVLLASLYPAGAVSGSPLLTATAPGMGVAGSFAVLGGSTVTNTGSSNVTGELGVSPGSSVTGFPPGSVTGGTIHIADAVAGQAQSDAGSAYNDLAGQGCDVNLTGQDLGGQTLTPGVYCFTSSAQLTGRLTLDFQGVSDAVFVFKIGSTLTTGSSASVSVINGGSICNVYWQVGSSATLGTGTDFAGNIFALASVTLTTGATVAGRTIARTGAVTMDSNTISNYACYRPPAATATATTVSGSPTPTTTLAPGTATAPSVPGSPTPTATQVSGTATATSVSASPTRTATSIPQAPTPTSIPQVSTPTSIPQVATATPAAATPSPTATVVPKKLPITGAPPTDMVSLVLAGAGAALIGLSLMLRRRRQL